MEHSSLYSVSSRVSFEPTETDLKTSSNAFHQDGSSSSNLMEAEEYEAWLEKHPSLLKNFHELEMMVTGKYVAIFLDYDGTLTPIVNDPDAAFMTQHMREAVKSVASVFPTAIISGRGREKVEQFVQLKELYYAGSHGMDIAPPSDTGIDKETAANISSFQPAAEFEHLMKQVGIQLQNAVRDIPGASMEDNKFCVSVHFRNCSIDDYDRVVSVVEKVVMQYPNLRITRGRKVLEIRPQIDWNKGSALLHLLDMLGLKDHGDDVFCLYIGDDRTDEDAFKVLKETCLGGGILVSSKVKDTAGRWTLRDPFEVAMFLQRLVAWGQTGANRWHESGGCVGWQMSEKARRKCPDLETAFQFLVSETTSGGYATKTNENVDITAASRLAQQSNTMMHCRPPLPQ